MQLGTELGLGSHATTIAEDIDRQLAEQEQFIRNNDCWDQVRAEAVGGSSSIVPDHLPGRQSAWRAQQHHGLGDPPDLGLQPDHLRLHPQTLAELADSSSEQLPGPIFSYLPHTNPLIIFPEPIPTFLFGELARGGGVMGASAGAATPVQGVDR